jgi:hypothetical protein
VDQQTTTQSEEQNVCEEEDHPPEPNSPFESLTEEVNPTEEETNLMHSPTATNSYTQISTHEGMTESTQRISSREAEEEDR